MTDDQNVVPQESVTETAADEVNDDGPDVVIDDNGNVSLKEASPAVADDDQEGQDPDPEPDTDEGDDEEDADENDDDGEQEPPEVVEFDFGGNKLEVPKGSVPPEVAEKLDKFSKDIWADYTKKSQANAEAAKEVKAKAEALELVETLGGEALDAFTRGKTIQSELQQLQQYDVNALWQSNPDQARQVSDLIAAKRAELQSIIETVDRHETAVKQHRQAELERVATEGRQLLDRKYKGFSSEIAPKLEAYAVKNGISEDDAKTWAASPVVAEFAYKAMLYDQMREAGRPKQNAAPKSPAQPVTPVKAKGSTRNTDPNKMGYGQLSKLLGY